MYHLRSSHTSVSIHVPTRGTTSRSGMHMQAVAVSIHVPTRGTTQYKESLSEFGKSFNPRSHEGNDVTAGTIVQMAMGFNPRSHEGNDASILHRSLESSRCFNPRSHEGNDDATPLVIIASPWVSIHVPTRGTTRTTRKSKSVSQFQSTFPRGERQKINDFKGQIMDVSIHVPTRGTTEKQENKQEAMFGFNPRSHEGNDSNYL